MGVRNDLSLSMNDFEWPTKVEKPHLKDYLVDLNNDISDDNLTRFQYYLKNPTNQGKYIVEDFLKEEFLIIDTRMSDLRLYRERVPTLRSQRDGIYYIKDGKIKELTGFEALLLQGFPLNLAMKVKDVVTNRHLLMQAGNAMTVNVIAAIGESLKVLFKEKGGIS